MRSVPSGENPLTASPAFAGLGTATGLPPLTFTRPIEDGELPAAPSKAAVSPFGERMNCEMFFASVVGLPPLGDSLIKLKLESKRIRRAGLQSIGSQQPSPDFAEYTM